jgi:hypothetical protein
VAKRVRNSNRPGVSRTNRKITDQVCLKSLEPEKRDKVTLGPEEERPGESGIGRPGVSRIDEKKQTRSVWRVWNQGRKTR